MAVGGGPDHALGAAGAGEPDVWAGVLHGLHPRIDHPVFEILALVPEGARFGPAPDDQVMGLLEPGEVLGGVVAGEQGLDGGAPHEAGDDPATGVTVQHGDLLGHADGVPHRDDVA